MEGKGREEARREGDVEGRSASVRQRNLENAGPDLEAMEAEKRVWKMTRSQRLACGGFSVKAVWTRGRGRTAAAGGRR